ncbi:MAG: rhomboid family intramembrane serine protease [Chloroflexota bacterium]
MYRMYRGSREFGVVAILIATNIIIFLATYFLDNLFYFLALKPSLVLVQPWTLVTSMFVHSGISHIFGNMVTLYFFGGFLSQLIGEKRLLFLYLLGGVLGNILYVMLAPSYSVAVGASGAVFAVGGALAVMRPKVKVFIFPIPVPLPLWVAVVGGFFILSFFPNVAWQAHLGGLLYGLVWGYLFRRRERRSIY